jgi:hypothetical protein
LLQRYGKPFAYIKGAVHAGLSTTGTLAIDRLLGVQVDVTASPAGHTVKLGNPSYLYDLGWLSVVTPDGFIDEVRLTRDHQLWQSRLFPMALSVNWALQAGVTITLTELHAEPL